MERILFRLFTFFEKIPFLRLLLRASDEKMSKIYPYDSFGRKVNAEKELLLQIMAFGVTVIPGFLLMIAGSIRAGYTFSVICVGILMFRLSGFVMYEKARHRMLCEIGDYIAELRHAFFKNNDTLEAVYEAWESAGEIMKLHLSVMERYFESEEIPEEYIYRAPDNFIISLLAILKNAIRYGDSKIKGHSSFLTNLEELEKDIFTKRLELEKDRAITRGTFFFVCLPVLFMPLMEKWGMAQIEDLKSFFEGPVGGIVRIAALLITIMVSRMFFIMRGDPGVRIYSEFAKDINLKEGKIARYTARLFEENFPGKNVREFYISRIFAALFVFLLGMSYMVIYGFTNGRLLGLVFSSIAASFYPYLELALEGTMLFNAKNGEVATYRRLLLMLSAIPGICTADILEELEKYSFYFKKEIGMCLDRYGDNDEHAFDELKQSGNKELARIAEDFYAIDRVGIKESFDDIPEQTLFYGQKRKQDLEILQGFKKNVLELMLYVPFTATVFMYLIIPFMYESMKSLGSFMDMTTTF
ncbi:MAG: hypothetical protein J6Z02_01630 [Lachnospiraceae bacterium]|nr:hypothetical protein [Lachnospiraceae bacterium]